MNLTRICNELKVFFTVNSCSILLSDVQRIFSGCVGCWECRFHSGIVSPSEAPIVPRISEIKLLEIIGENACPQTTFLANHV